MIWTGIMGGSSYVNVNRLILDCNYIDQNKKDLTIGICEFFI